MRDLGVAYKKLGDYYHSERNRAEQCITDIFNTVCEDAADPDSVVDRVLERLIAYYQRETQQT